MALEYDNSAFYYFALACIVMYVIPTSYWLGYQIYQSTQELLGYERAKTAEEKKHDSARTEAERLKYQEETRSKGSERFASCTFWTNLVLCLLGMVSIYLIIQAVATDADIAQFDPYKILDIEEGATLRQIKRAYRKMSLKYHPDRNIGDQTAAEKFIRVAKAHATLTDDAARENYEKYGNPDGRQALEVSIGLPTIFSNEEWQSTVLLVYFILLCVVIPGAVALYYNYSQEYSDAYIKIESHKWFNFHFSTTPQTLIDKLTSIITTAQEFHHFEWDLKDKADLRLEKFNKSLIQNKMALHKASGHIAQTQQKYPGTKKANILLSCYVLRRGVNFLLKGERQTQENSDYKQITYTPKYAVSKTKGPNNKKDSTGGTSGGGGGKQQQTKNAENNPAQIAIKKLENAKEIKATSRYKFKDDEKSGGFKLSKRQQTELIYILKKSEGLIKAMRELPLLRPPRQMVTLINLSHLSQCITQGFWKGAHPLLQLPHFDYDAIKIYHRIVGKDRFNICEFIQDSDVAKDIRMQTYAMAGFNEVMVQEVENVCATMTNPHVSFRVGVDLSDQSNFGLLDEEEERRLAALPESKRPADWSDKIGAGDIICVEVTLMRDAYVQRFERRKRDVLSKLLSKKDAGDKENIAKRVREEMKSLEDEMKADVKKARKICDDSKLARRERNPVKVKAYSRFFPTTVDETWSIYAGNPQNGYLSSFSDFSFRQGEDVIVRKLKFQAPHEPCRIQFYVTLCCNSYVAFDKPFHLGCVVNEPVKIDMTQENKDWEEMEKNQEPNLWDLIGIEEEENSDFEDEKENSDEEEDEENEKEESEETKTNGKKPSKSKKAQRNEDEEDQEKVAKDNEAMAAMDAEEAKAKVEGDIELTHKSKKGGKKSTAPAALHDDDSDDDEGEDIGVDESDYQLVEKE